MGDVLCPTSVLSYLCYVCRGGAFALRSAPSQSKRAGRVSTMLRSGRHSIFLVILAAAMAVVLLIGLGQEPAQADVTGVKGSAYGYFSSISLFGGPPSTRGPTPTVTLPPSGSATPITASQASGSATYGPAILFSSGQLDVSTQGTTGPMGSVTTSTNIQGVNTSGTEVFTASNVASRCTASEAGVSGSTTITSGTLQTSEGNPDVEGDETTVNIPTNPAPNTTYNGQIESVGDSYRYVFNEQIRNPDGSITVNAAHQYFLGPTAVGDLIIGQSVCGVTAPPDDVSPAAPIISSPANNSYDLDGTIAFSGTAEANATVKIFEGTTVKATTTASTSGAWSKTLTGVANGPHTYTAKATDAAGNTSAASSPKTVTVDKVKPRVLGTSPLSGATGVAPGANVLANFSEGMNVNTLRNPTTLRSTTFKLARKNPDGTKTAVVAKVSFSVTTNPTTGAKVYKATLNPDANLQRGKTYVAMVTSGSKDVAGNALDQNPSVTGNQGKVWSFKVRN